MRIRFNAIFAGGVHMSMQEGCKLDPAGDTSQSIKSKTMDFLWCVPKSHILRFTVFVPPLPSAWDGICCSAGRRVSGCFRIKLSIGGTCVLARIMMRQ